MKRPMPPRPTSELLHGLPSERLIKIVTQNAEGAASRPYLPWDKVRYLQPPADLTVEEWWLSIKVARQGMLRAIPLMDVEGGRFSYALPDDVLRLLNMIDREASGQISLSEEVTNPASRDRYIVSSLIEEAITSSQLEGASTTRNVAKEMLRSGRPPRDKSEKMILNNYLAMRRVQELRDRELDPEMVCEIHRLVTQETLDEDSAAGRLQSPEDERVAVYDAEDHLLFRPPPAEQLPGRLESMCDFANGRTGPVYVHPVIRAVILHFWLAHDHPFEDGNGRTARALFYWSMLKSGYWLAEFVSISRILKRAPSKYAKSFLYTESDDNDLTYFLLYQLEAIERSIGDLQVYLKRKMAEVRDVRALLRKSTATFNHRQLALLTYALKELDVVFTIASHAASHNVVYETARTDLLELSSRGLLARARRGNAFVFTPVDDLPERLRQLG